jgi:RNA polymerase sigma-70 factor (ECF subfamily)
LTILYRSAVSTDASFADLMVRLRSGEDDAARALFVRFARRLVGLARGHLGGRLAAKVDPEDVVQSAYKSFFVRHRQGDLEVGSWDGLWGLLTLITLRKCADRAAHFRTERRDLAREVPQPATDSAAGAWQLAVDRDPRPDEAAVLAETVQALFRSLDPDERGVLELSLQGYTATEISASLNRAERSVRRLRERVRKRLERMRVE